MSFTIGCKRVMHTDILDPRLYYAWFKQGNSFGWPVAWLLGLGCSTQNCYLALNHAKNSIEVVQRLSGTGHQDRRGAIPVQIPGGLFNELEPLFTRQ